MSEPQSRWTRYALGWLAYHRLIDERAKARLEAKELFRGLFEKFHQVA